MEGLHYSLWMNKQKWWLKRGFRKQEFLRTLWQYIKHERKNFSKRVHVLLSIPEFNLMVQAVFAAGSEYQMDETCYNTLEYSTLLLFMCIWSRLTIYSLDFRMPSWRTYLSFFHQFLADACSSLLRNET